LIDRWITRLRGNHKRYFIEFQGLLVGSDYIAELIENLPKNPAMVLENPTLHFSNKFSNVTLLVLPVTVHAGNSLNDRYPSEKLGGFY
jgi:hypothetical protein